MGAGGAGAREGALSDAPRLAPWEALSDGGSGRGVVFDVTPASPGGDGARARSAGGCLMGRLLAAGGGGMAWAVRTGAEEESAAVFSEADASPSVSGWRAASERRAGQDQSHEPGDDARAAPPGLALDRIHELQRPPDRREALLGCRRFVQRKGRADDGVQLDGRATRGERRRIRRAGRTLGEPSAVSAVLSMMASARSAVSAGTGSSSRGSVGGAGLSGVPSPPERARHETRAGTP